MVQTFRLPAKCSASQHRRLTVIFGMCSELYNAALESWKGTYAWWKEHHNPEREKFPDGLSQSQGKEILKKAIRPVVVGPRQDTGIQSLESWCPV